MGPPNKQKSILSFFKTPPKPDKILEESKNDKVKSPEKTQIQAVSSTKEKNSSKEDDEAEPVKDEEESEMDVSIATNSSLTEGDSSIVETEEEIIPQRKTARKSCGGAKKFLKAEKISDQEKTSKRKSQEPAKATNTKTNDEISNAKQEKTKLSNISQLSSSDDDEESVNHHSKKRKRNIIPDDSPVKRTSLKKKRAIISDDEENEEVKKKTKPEKDDSDEEDAAEKEEDSKKPTEEDKEVGTKDNSSESPKSVETDSKPKNPFSKFFAPQKKSEDKTETNSNEKPKEVYNPTKHNYHPIDDACWKKGEKVPYLALARTLEEVEEISARLKMIEILANFFRSVIVLTPDDLLHSVYLCLNRLAPEYEGIELGVGETLLMKAVAQATGRTVDKIKAEVSVKGDLALVAESSRGNQRLMLAFPKLTVSSVFAKFKAIAQMSGNSAMSKKTEKILAIFSACRFSEARYIIRSLGGKLRIGLAEQSVLAALAQASVLTPPNQSYPPKVIAAYANTSSDTFKKKLEKEALILKNAYCECPNYDILIPVLLKEGIANLPKHCYLSPGIPLKPMLAHPTKGVEEVLRRFDTNEFTCEFKYDGERAQIHILENGTVNIYSRNQENNTTKYPDIISRLPKALEAHTKSFILDTEVIAWDKVTEQILPFQVLSTRKRKDASSSEITVQVCIVAFDLLYLNGESLIRKPLKERRKLMKKSFKEVKSEFMFANSTDGNTAEIMQEFLEESIKGKCEGLMVKSLVVDATYEIAKRSHNWLKLKKDYLDSVGDTLDLVVLGGWYGKGKRTGAYGGFLLACYDDETEEFQTICKIGTGFKDEDLETHNKFLKEHVISSAKSYYRYDSSIEPDNWFEPLQVWEVKCADLSISPVHKAAVGIVDPVKGVSLRFPRFLKIRDDKKPEDATTASQVAKMYNSQEQVQDQKQNTSKFEDEDFY